MVRWTSRSKLLIASALIALLVAHAAHAATWSLGAPVQVETGVHANAAIVADFSGDTKNDLALTDTVNNKVAVFLNEPPSLYSWSLERSGSYTIDSGPVAISAGTPLESAGNDIVTASSGATGNLSLLPGNGDGTFQGMINIPLGGGVFPVSVGVLGMDVGFTDDVFTAVNTPGGAELLAYLFDPIGGHGSAIPTPLGSHAHTVVDYCASGMFDADMYPDLAVLSHYTNSTGTHYELGIYPGFGNGYFDPPTTYELPSQCERLAVGDFNGDSYSDVAAISYDADKVYVYTSSFVSPLLGQSAVLDTPTGPTDILVADLNKDDMADLVVASGGTTVSVYLGNDNGTFQARQDFFVSGGASWLALADLDGDGVLDIITGGSNTNFSVLPGSIRFSLSTFVNPSCAGSVQVAETGPCSSGSTLHIQANAGAGWKFDYWVGPVANSTVNPTTVTMSNDTGVVALFSRDGIALSMTQQGAVVNLSGKYISNPSVPDGTTLKYLMKYSADGSTWPANWSTKTLGKTIYGEVAGKSFKARAGYYKFQACYLPKSGTPVYDAYIIDCKVQPVIVLTGPADKTVTTDPAPAISWEPYDGAGGYEVQISTSKKFRTVLHAYRYDGADTTSGMIPYLPEGQKTYWRVVARLSDWQSTSLPSTPRQITYVPAP